MVTMLVWLVMTIVALIACRPVSKVWEPLVQGTCYNFNAFVFGSGLFDTLLDCLVLVLPVKSILGLQMPMSRKLSICGIFLVGGL